MASLKRKNSAEDPGNIQSEGRKRRPTARLTDNADPLLKNRGPKPGPHGVAQPRNVNAREHEPASSASTPASSAHTAASTTHLRRQSFEIEEIEDEDAVIRHPRPRNPTRIVESDEDDELDDGGPATQPTSDVDMVDVGTEAPEDTDVESDDVVEETADEQLSESHIIDMLARLLTSMQRTTYRGLECTNLCVLPPHPVYRTYSG